MKTKQLLAGTCLILLSLYAKTQCLTPPLFPDCTGSETLVQNGDIIANTETKWFYGTSSTLSNITLRGGTLIVCSDLTINNLALDSGTIVVKAEGKLVVSNGAGLVMRGGCAIYNWGSFQSLGNIVMDYGTASAVRPNIIINATTAASWIMPNQYFVINNPYSKFVNMGTASFHGIITDPGATPGSVCLGDGSSVSMMVLYNKSKNSYIVPSGAACLSVSQFSQFYDTLTTSSNLNVCLGTSHYSDASCTPWGCKPNAWGSAQVMNNCTFCSSSLTTLPIQFSSINVTSFASYNEIKWMAENVRETAMFYLQHSLDGSSFSVIDSIKGNSERDYLLKHSPPKTGRQYYRIQYSQSLTGQRSHSKIVSCMQSQGSLSAFPNPFKSDLTISVPGATKWLNIGLIDMYGRKISLPSIHRENKAIKLSLPQLPEGHYLLRLEDGGKTQTLKIQKTN